MLGPAPLTPPVISQTQKGTSLIEKGISPTPPVILQKPAVIPPTGFGASPDRLEATSFACAALLFRLLSIAGPIQCTAIKAKSGVFEPVQQICTGKGAKDTRAPCNLPEQNG